jgi:hypothetical protein
MSIFPLGASADDRCSKTAAWRTTMAAGPELVTGSDGWRPEGAGRHHPPERYTRPVSALRLVFLVLSLTLRRGREAAS